MEFEFDPAKSASNKEKHGIDFVEAQRLWEDPKRMIVPATSKGEERFALLAEFRKRIWAAIFTVRGERARIISVRRARNEEKEGYHLGRGV
jgi:uncharacterized DUF497 family protein